MNQEWIIKNLIEIYGLDGNGERFRHLYSEIFAQLTVLSNEEQESVSDVSIDMLIEKLHTLKQDVFDNKERIKEIPNEVREGFLKLYDHINLDVARINYTKSIQQKTESLYKKSTDLTKNIEKANMNLTQIKTDVKNIKVDHITILGIFYSVVLLFVGGMSFSTSILKYIHTVPTSTLLLVGGFICLVFFDVIWLLLEFILKITDRKSTWPKYVGIIFNSIVVIILVICSFKTFNDFDSNKEQIIYENAPIQTEISENGD